MEVALGLLMVQGALGAFDTLFYHEWMHAVLDDAGLSNILTKAVGESICDAAATARLQELRGLLGIFEARHLDVDAIAADLGEGQFVDAQPVEAGLQL